MTRQIGIAHLTLLPLTPPEIVEVAAAVGLDFVGLRVHPVTAQEQIADMHPGAPALHETISRLRDSEISVRDIEFLALTAQSGPADWQEALEVGALLGATIFTVAGADPDRSRLTDTLARLAADAAPFGIRAALEAISYQSVSRVDEAAAIARTAGAALMLDPLHIQRGGSSIDDVAALEAELVPVVQLCDAPLTLDLSTAAPADARQFEARRNRLIVGDGELPLAELLAAVPGDVPVSLEVPNDALRARMSVNDFAALNLQAARELVTRVELDGAADQEGRRDA
ncbi:sugar phosphate isomerase/epimerase [Microbacterium protaetiae]|uniref:Sugar phosphate isomerase/epimerase n=1 Tax=Microbacterium protaetiae TaxID=2509458 RepID=A0A4P6EAW6_9MICO|nr:TIM barrel protein [Microbacterium protaetiae]QAY59290.1 sugar phosphate isomerase/epimerase [Microbacterium protaetiae]